MAYQGDLGHQLMTRLRGIGMDSRWSLGSQESVVHAATDLTLFDRGTAVSVLTLTDEQLVNWDWAAIDQHVLQWIMHYVGPTPKTTPRPVTDAVAAFAAVGQAAAQSAQAFDQLGQAIGAFGQQLTGAMVALEPVIREVSPEPGGAEVQIVVRREPGKRAITFED